MKWLLCLLVAGCATETAERPGPVVSEVVHEVRVCLDGGTLREGSRVTFSRRVCRGNPKHVALDCRYAPIGTGQVVRVLDQRCALVEIADDGDVHSGDQVALAP